MLFRFQVVALCTAALTLASTTPALAFDWAGKLARDLRLLKSPSATLRKQAVYRLGRYRKAQVEHYILRALRDIDPGVQRAAAEVAAEQRLAAATPIFVGWMSHWEDDLRLAAAEALGRIGGPLALKTLVRALVDPEPKIRLKSVNALATLALSARDVKGRALRKRTVVPIVGRLQDQNTGIRLAAARVLGQLGDKRAVIPLMGRLSDLGHKVRVASITALGKLGDPRSGPAITRLLSDHAPAVVQAAIKTLGVLRYRGATEPLIEMLSSHRHRTLVAQALARIGTDLAIRSLVASLSKSSLANAAKTALAQATKQNPKPINWLLKDPRTPRNVALVAVEIARDAKLRGAVPLLVEQLELKRLPRAIVIRALGAIGDRRAQRPLLGLLGANSVDIQLAALEALKRLIDGRAAEPLARCLASPNRAVRRIAITYLGRLRARIATPALIRLARTAPRDEARHAATALAAIGDPRAQDELLRLLVHHDRLLRRIGVHGLAALAPAPKVARRVLTMCRRQTLLVRSSCLQALGNLLRGSTDSAVLSYLASNIGLGDHTLFLSALDGLAAMKDPRIVKILLGRIPQLPLALKRHAVEALGNQPSAEAVSALRRLLSDKESAIRGAAAWALGKLRAKTARDDLLRVARGKGWAARINATAALAALRDPSIASALKSLAADRAPYVRANALLGLGWIATGAAPSVPQLVRHAQHDRTPWARANALRALFAIKTTRLTSSEGRPITNATLAKEMAKVDLDDRVRHIAATLAKRGSRAVREQKNRQSWIGLYLVDAEGRPLSNRRYLLITPEGLVKASYADMRSQGWEERLPKGRCHVELPVRPLAASPASTDE